METLVISISGLIIIFFLNIVIGLFLGFGIRHYWFFEFLHFLSGFFVTMFLASFFGSRLLILSGLAVVTFIWELAEYMLDKIPAASQYFKKTFRTDSTRYDLKDTILDIILNFAGAFIFFLILSNFSAG